MSKNEMPLTRRYWQSIGGTLVQEFPAVRRAPNQGQRLLDGVVILGGPKTIAKPEDVQIAGREIVVIQTKANRLGMYLLGQALFSRHLMERLGPKSVRTVAVCTKDDAVLRPLATQYGIEVVVYPA